MDYERTIPETGKDFEVVPVSASMDISSQGYRKLDTSDYDMATLSSCLQHYILNEASDVLENAYVIRFPEGMPHTLLKLKDDWYTTTIVGPDHKFMATAEIREIVGYSELLNLFSAMSFATGQFFMTTINNQLEVVNSKLDAILDFLTNEHDSELIAEISFVRYAYENFNYISQYSEQRQATIASLQAAKKVAIAHVEFSMNQLAQDAQKVHNQKNSKDLIIFGNEKQWADFNNRLKMAQQLYVIANTLEVFYSQNFNSGYLKMMKKDVENYMDECKLREMRLLPAVANDIGKSNGIPGLPKSKDKSPLVIAIEKELDILQKEKYPEMVRSFESILDSAVQPSEYYVKLNGDVYLKTATT